VERLFKGEAGFGIGYIYYLLFTDIAGSVIGVIHGFCQSNGNQTFLRPSLVRLWNISPV
jgi:hypothetical protein